MKTTKTLSILLFIIMFYACGTAPTPEFPTGGGNTGGGNTGGSTGGNTTVTQPTASFSYTKEQPLKAVFTNKSSDAKTYLWNFGDGTTSTEANPIHRYNSKGVYAVTLKATNGSKSDTYSSNVTITEPTACYVDKCEFIKIPTNNEYYRIEVTDSYTLSATYYYKSSWCLLSSANLPYTCTSSTSKECSEKNPSGGYYISVYRNSKNSGDGTRIARFSSLKKDKLYSEFPDGYSFTSDNGKLEVNVWFKWK